MSKCGERLKSKYISHLLWLFNIEGGHQAIFTNEEFSGEDFSKMYLCGAVFEDCTFLDCLFYHSSMSGSNFRNCTFIETSFMDSNFNGCDMLNSRFDNCFLEYSSFEGSSLYHANFDRSSCYICGCDFTYSCIDDCNITKMDTRNSFMAGAYVDFSQFALNTETKLSDCEAMPPIYPFHYLGGYIDEQ